MSEYWVPTRGSTGAFLNPDILRYFQNISVDKNNGWLRYDGSTPMTTGYDETIKRIGELLKWTGKISGATVLNSESNGSVAVNDDDEGMSKEDLDESQKLLYEFLGVTEPDCEK